MAAAACIPVAKSIVRAFYANESVVIFDALVSSKTSHVKDTDLAESIGLSPKLVRQTLQKLKIDGLIKGISQKQTNVRQKTTVMLWNFDHERFVSVFLYRLILMRKASGSKSQMKAPDESFVCQNEHCFFKDKPLSTFEVINSASRGGGHLAFVCENCNEPLHQMSDSIDNLSAHEDVKLRMNVQLRDLEDKIAAVAKLIQQERIEAAAADAAAARAAASEKTERHEDVMTSEQLTGRESVSVTIQKNDQPQKKKKRAPLLPWATTAEDEKDVLVRAVKDDTLDDGECDTEEKFEQNYALLLSKQEKLLKKKKHEEEKEDTKPEPANDLPPVETSSTSPLTVLVNGEEVPFDALEEKHFNTMSEQEYEEYCKLVAASGIDYDNDEF